MTAPFDRRKVVLHRFTCFWASLYTWLNPAWPVRVEGRERIRPDETYVMVSNHLSLLDILVLFRLFRHFKWVSKIENFRVPCIGWNMSMNRYVKLRRGDRASVVQMMQACDTLLAEGNSIMMFPEGTRSPTGRLRALQDRRLRARAAQPPADPPDRDHRAPPTRCRSAASCCAGGTRCGSACSTRSPTRASPAMDAEKLTDQVRELLAAEVGEARVEPPVAKTA